jgi:pimeloyl-ACP methyl ester carboxylesterase
MVRPPARLCKWRNPAAAGECAAAAAPRIALAPRSKRRYLARQGLENGPSCHMGGTMGKGWKLCIIGAIVIFAGAILAHFIQGSGGTKVRDIRFVASNGVMMSALLYIPANATAKTPAPGILAVHGYINSRETQDAFAIEFARRGYVVLALDQRGHGYSDGPAFADGFGGPAGLSYLRSLDIVDKDNIGLEGHSMGGWTVLAAAAVAPNDYKSMVLEGSSVGKPFAAEGTPNWPRNVAVVTGRFDEFSKLMWDVDRAADIGQSPKLEALFGTDKPVEIGKLYGSIEAGDARKFYQPGLTHTAEHITTEAIGDALDWFGQTLKGGVARPVADQIWYWKEIGTLVCLIGFLAFLLGAFDIVLTLPIFASLVHKPTPGRTKRSAGWWVAFILATLLPAIVYFPAVGIAYTNLPASPQMPQHISNCIVLWAVATAVLSLILSLFTGGRGAKFDNDWAKSLAAAGLTVFIGYGILALVQTAYLVDFRFYLVGLKLMSPAQMKIFTIYIVPLTFFCLITMRSLHASLGVEGTSAIGQYVTNILAFTGGFALLIAAVYATLFSTGQLPAADLALFAIVGIQFIPVLAILAIISTFAYRRTNSYVPGAFLSALFVTWYIVAAQATQAAI